MKKGSASIQYKKYRIYKIDAETIVKTLELYGKIQELHDKVASCDVIAEGLDISRRKAREALRAAEELRLLEFSKEFALGKPEKQKLIFRKALQSFKPFLDFIFFLEKGNNPEEASRKVKAIYHIERKTGDLLWIFKKWGNYAGIFVNNSFEFVDELKDKRPSIIGELLNEINNDLKAKIWLEKVLGNAKNYILEDEYELLMEAILNIQKDPRKSIQAAGQAIEDFLRKIAIDRKVDVSKKNGIYQIAEELRKNNILASKHIPILKGLQVFLDRDIYEGFAAFRNMASHNMDKKEMKKWELSEDLALSFVIQAILCIKSLYYYVVEDKLIF